MTKKDHVDQCNGTNKSTASHGHLVSLTEDKPHDNVEYCNKQNSMNNVSRCGFHYILYLDLNSILNNQ